MFRMYASNSHSYTHLILALVSLESLQYGHLLLQNILAYMTLACLTYLGGRTDDLVRVFITLRYRALKSTPFSRLAFFQFGSETYNYRATPPSAASHYSLSLIPSTGTMLGSICHNVSDLNTTRTTRTCWSVHAKNKFAGRTMPFKLEMPRSW